MFIEILVKILLFKEGVLIYAEHCVYIYIYIYIYIIDMGISRLIRLVPIALQSAEDPTSWRHLLTIRCKRSPNMDNYTLYKPSTNVVIKDYYKQ